LVFDHIVEFTQDATVFAAAREEERGYLRLFLLNAATGNVYTRHGRIDSWQQLFGSLRDTVVAHVTAARNRAIPVYQVTETTGNGALK
jgi:hypothetical protein